MIIKINRNNDVNNNNNNSYINSNSNNSTNETKLNNIQVFYFDGRPMKLVN